MMIQKKTLLSIAVGLVLAGCGGGGGYNPPGTSMGTAIDGYIFGAAIICDSTPNGAYDIGETRVFTDINGDFDFTNTTSGACPSNVSIIGFGGTNTDTKQPFKGLMKAPGGSRYITPLTTLMVDTGLSAAELATYLGLPAGSDVTQLNPMNDLSLQKKTLAVQLILQQSAEAIGASAGDTSPETIRFIYSEVAKALGMALSTSSVPLIDGNNEIASSLVSSAITSSVSNIKGSNNPALANIKIELASVSGIAVASKFSNLIVNQAETLAQASTSAQLTSVVELLNETFFFDAQKNVISIVDDTIEFNGNPYSLTDFAAGTPKFATFESLGFDYAVTGLPIPLNAGLRTASVEIGIELTSDRSQILQVIMDKINVTLTGTQLSVTIPSNAQMHVYGKSSIASGGTVVTGAIPYSTADDLFVAANGKMTVNAGKMLDKLGSNGAELAILKDLKGTFTTRMVISNLSIAGKTLNSVQGSSVTVTGTSKSVTGLGVQGKFTIQ